MTAEISGEKVVCRGVVHRLKEDKTALQAETETFGGAMKPLYVYFGDGKVLCGAENARAAVVIGDKVFTADAVKISHEAKVKRYYAIGEENPYAAVAGKAVYTIVLHGFSGGEEALPGEFTLQTGGARYTHCVLKAASENKLVIEAGACEKITRRTQSGTEA